MAAESMLASSSTPSVLSTQSDEDASLGSMTAAGEFRRSLLEKTQRAASKMCPELQSKDAHRRNSCQRR